MSADMSDDVPSGLVNGWAPLLAAFVQKRFAMRRRAVHARHLLTVTPCPPIFLLTEHNALVDILCGRRAP